MKMRLGRAGEAYFVRETQELPPPEFRASIDPEHGLSDDEMDGLEPRAVQDDWADPRDDKQRQGDAAIGEEMDWGAVHALNKGEVARAGLDHGQHAPMEHRGSLDTTLGVVEGDSRLTIGNIKGSASAHAIINSKATSPAALASSSSSHHTNATQTTSDTTSLEHSYAESRQSPTIPPSRRSLDGSSEDRPSTYDDLSVSQRDHLNTSDPTIPIAYSPSPTSNLSATAEPSPKKPSKKESKPKSWGLSLFGFLGPKKDQETSEDDQGQAVDNNPSNDRHESKPQTATKSSLARSAEYETGHPGGGMGRSSSFVGDKLGLSGDEIHYQGDHNREGAVQSSSLPNNWGPSPLFGASKSGHKSPYDEGYTSGRDDRSDGGRSYDEERSRAAEDGSGVIYVGQKRKARSSSITSTTLATGSGQAQRGGPHNTSPPPQTTISPSTGSNISPSPDHVSGISTPPLPSTHGGHPRSALNSSDHRRSKSVERPSSNAAGNSSTRSISSAASVGSAASDEDDEEYHDMVFEMDEEAYQAANPGAAMAGDLDRLEGGGADPAAEIVSTPQQRSASSGGHSSRLPLVEISRCGFNAVAIHDTDPLAAQEAFNSARVGWQAMNDEPNLLFAPEIVFRISGLYYPFSAAAPILFSVAAFNTPLSSQSVGKLVSQAKSARQQSSSKSWGRWFGFGNKSDGIQGSTMNASTASNSSVIAQSSSAASNLNGSMMSPPPHAKGVAGDKRSSVSSTGQGIFATPSSSASLATGPVGVSGAASGTHLPDPEEASYVNASGVISPRTTRALNTKLKHGNGANAAGGNGAPGTKPFDVEVSDYSGSSPVPGSGSTGSNAIGTASGTPTYYVRSLKPTSDQLKSLNLKPGPNQVVFRVNSRLQGAQQVVSTVYLWDRDSKVVISDIDGTITKSDVLGQIFPVFGKDWSHSGVAALFQSIKANGYEILYLTARAIGAAKLTKGFLTSLQQDSVHLPDGPVFMSPDRLLHSLNREVILRRPEQFKIQCLTEIKELFLGPGAATKDPGPFYAGFGNRDTDAVSYVAVGIPVGKTFTINPSGEITGHVKSIQRTYTKIHELVEQMFPPHHKSDQKKKQSRKEHLEQWNDFQYWESRPSGMSLEDIEKELLS
jgi:hypothetical protein